MKRVFYLAFLALALCAVRVLADEPDDEYINIYGLIQQADLLSDSGDAAQARAVYVQAQTALERFQKIFPDWNPRVVNFRLNYLGARISSLAPPAPAAATNAPAVQPATVPILESAETARQLAFLHDLVAQLQAENTNLQSKLKEAYATQPASVDPRELAHAQEQIQSLARENDLLKVSLTNQPSEMANIDDAKVMEAARLALVEANRKLADQTERANGLALEKQVLQDRLDKLSSLTNAAADLEVTRKALDESNKKLSEQTDLANRLTSDKKDLQSRIDTLMASADAAVALRQENEILKKQIVVANSSVSRLQSQSDVLQLERNALQDRLKEANTQIASHTEDAARIKQLVDERDDLQRRLAAMQSAPVAVPKEKPGTLKARELSKQVDTLRARLDALEAQAVPYNPEELALFKKSEDQVPTAQPVVATSLPPGTTALATEAQNYFAARQFDQAELKYDEILSRDESNAYTLANLAVIEMEAGHYDKAEKHLKLVLAQTPNDAHCLSLLGNLRVREQKIDEAVDLLSRAAAINSQSAEIQNFLGLALAQKGMRQAAETALRKAITIDPTYGNAHNNLAVIYATQQPPLLELARLHYQKALADGQPRNPELEKMLVDKSDATTQ